jgi:hypothetical protein
MAQVRIRVDKDGNAKIIDVAGAGTNCMEATKNFEKALGQVKEENRQLTESYYEVLPEQQLEQEGG